MLQNLEILNGEMTPKFDMYTDTYSVLVKNNIDYLDIKYIIDDDCSINIIGNEYLIEGENKVYIEVTGNEKNIYTLLVNKEETETVMNYDFGEHTIDVEKELPLYIAPLIAISCFLIILFTYSILFSKKKHK